MKKTYTSRKKYFSWLTKESEQTGKGPHHYYACDYIYRSARGVVSIDVHEWKDTRYTAFEVIHNGMEHTMRLDVTGLSRRQLMLYSAQFLKGVHGEDWKQTK